MTLPKIKAACVNSQLCSANICRLFLPGFVCSIPSADLSCHMKTAPGESFSRFGRGQIEGRKLNHHKKPKVALAELMQPLSGIEIEMRRRSNGG